MTVGTQARALASTYIGRYGEPVTLYHRPPALFNPATDTASATPIEYDTSGAVSTYTTVDQGDLVKRGDLKVIVPAAGLPVQPDAAAWSITVRGRRREILAVETVGATGTDACYLIAAKGSR